MIFYFKYPPPIICKWNIYFDKYIIQIIEKTWNYKEIARDPRFGSNILVRVQPSPDVAQQNSPLGITLLSENIS